MNTTEFRWLTAKRKTVRITAALAVLFACLNGAHAQRLIAWPMMHPPAALPMPNRLPPPAERPSAPAPERPVAPPVVAVPPAEVVVPHPTVLPLPPQARVLPITRRALEGTISDDAAHLTLAVRFFNDSERMLEGDLYMPIPKDVVFDSLEMRVGDKVMRAELLDAATARQTYEGIVKQLRDPALLELVNDHLMRARVFPIPPHAAVELRFSYIQTVPKEGNLRTLSIPAMRFADEARHSERVLDLRLTASHPLRLVYSPTHKIEVRRKGDREAMVWYGGEAMEAQKEMLLMYSVDEGPLSVSLSAHREDGEPGTFLLTMDPRPQQIGKATPKDIVFVLDRSASMNDDGKIEQLRKALTYCLKHLAPQDRVSLVDFGTGVQTFSDTLLVATPANIARALKYVETLEASGGTNIEAALKEALGMLKREPGRLPIVVFLTDGRPTVGETDSQRLLGQFRSLDKESGARFFAFGIGADVNSSLLDQLADVGRGVRDYVLPGEDLEPKVARLYDRIAKPALTDVTLAWSGGGVSELYPRKVSDLYFGDPLVLLGRYSGSGDATLTVTGKAGPRSVRYEVPVHFPESASANPFLPRLWAYRKVAQLLDDARLADKTDPKMEEAIVMLARRYGIVTPYTSFLIADDQDMERVRPRLRQNLAAMSSEAAGAAAPESALRALSFSRDVQMMISGASASLGGSEDAGAWSPARKAARAEVRSAGGKTFYRREGRWVDSEWQTRRGRLPLEEIKAYGAAYFRLMRRHPELAQALAQGGDYLVVLDGTAYRITE